ncbi:unnamed protein product [Camellia sinensis]
MAAKQSGLGFLDSSENSLPPPPPSLEVLPSEVSSSETYTMEPVHLSGRTLLKVLEATGLHFHKYLSRGSSSEDQTSFLTCTRLAS